MNALNQYRKEIAIVVRKVRQTGWDERVYTQDGSEVYGYPRGLSVAWGVNAPGTGWNILRGIRTKSGEDVCVM
jgi:hypothetical protein